MNGVRGSVARLGSALLGLARRGVAQRGGRSSGTMEPEQRDED